MAENLYSTVGFCATYPPTRTETSSGSFRWFPSTFDTHFLYHPKERRGWPCIFILSPSTYPVDSDCPTALPARLSYQFVLPHYKSSFASDGPDGPWCLSVGPCLLYRHLEHVSNAGKWYITHFFVYHSKTKSWKYRNKYPDVEIVW